MNLWKIVVGAWLATIYLALFWGLPMLVVLSEGHGLFEGLLLGGFCHVAILLYVGWMWVGVSLFEKTIDHTSRKRRLK